MNHPASRVRCGCGHYGHWCRDNEWCSDEWAGEAMSIMTGNESQESYQVMIVFDLDRRIMTRVSVVVGN